MELPKEKLGFLPLIEIKKEVDSYLEDLKNGEINEDNHDDYKHSIYQEVMEALYGEEIWNYINSFYEEQ